jgi:uncharacterized protein DUF6790
MIANAIAFVLSNLPAIMFVGAFVLTAVTERPAYFPARLLRWLLLSIGIAYTWAGFFHIVFPHVAASSIGWDVSPFQFEIGVADASIGIIAIISFWRSLDFQAPVVGYMTLFSLGVAFGHFREAFYAGNTSKNNFGLLLVITLIHAVLLPVLYFMARGRDGRPT